MLLLQPVSPHNAHYNHSDLLEVPELELSFSLDCERDPSATGHSNWLSAQWSHSLAPELANTQPPESEELSTIQTPGSNLDQENLPDEANLSDFIPRAYIYPFDPATTEWGIKSHFPIFFTTLTSNSKSSIINIIILLIF